MLEKGYGGLVLCAKPDERQRWQWYAERTGRQTDLRIVEGGDPPPFRFNFLGRKDHTENVVHLLSTLLEVVEGKRSNEGGETFWERASQELLRNAVDLLHLSQGTLTLHDIYQLIVSAPRSPAEEADAKWQGNSFCASLVRAAGGKQDKTPREQNDFAVCSRYWLKTYPALADRTRSSIVATFTSMADMLLHGLAWQLFGTDTTLEPEETFGGRIIVLDLPLQRYHDLGKLAQAVWKLMWQRAVLARDIKPNTRPVFLFADEGQEFVTSYDFRYQARARSFRAATVLLAQNISAYYSVMGKHGEHETHALLGNLATKVFHAQSDHATNKYASDLFGEQWEAISTAGRQMGQHPTMTTSATPQVHKKVLPSEFTALRRGGGYVEAIVTQSGRLWSSSGDTHTRVLLTQRGPHG